MPDLNLVQLMGRLTADPELRRIASGTAVTELRMAVNKEWKDKNGDKKKEVLFADVTLWDKGAEIACQYLRKGSSVYVQGSLKLESWEDKTTGEKRTKMKIVGDNFQFLDSKPKDGGGNGGDYQEQPRGRAETPAASRGGAPAGRGGAPAPRSAPAAPYTQQEADDLDIPFSRPLSFDENEFFGPSVF